MNARIPRPNLPNASGLSVLSFSAAFGPMIGMAIESSSTFGLSKSWWAARRMATRRAVLLGRASIMAQLYDENTSKSKRDPSASQNRSLRDDDPGRVVILFQGLLSLSQP